MNNRKSKVRKRRSNNPEESSSDESTNQNEPHCSNAQDKSSSSSSDDESSDSDTSSESSSNVKIVRRKKIPGHVLLSESSDSGDETSEKCAICLRSITSQQVGNPEGCDHLFCSLCIIEWSKNSNVCPLDRQPFSIILVRENKDGEVAEKVPVEDPQAVGDDDLVFVGLYDTVCEVCGSGDREDILLLCDLCDRGFHTVCLNPPLESVPDENEWYCPYCIYGNSNPNETLTEFFDIPSTSRRSLRPQFQMVRTRLLVRVRDTVNRIVANYVTLNSDWGESGDNTQSEMSDTTVLYSDSESEPVREDVPGPSKPKAKGKKKKTIKRKSTKSRKRGSKMKKRTTSRRKKTTSIRKKTTTSTTTSTKKRKTKRKKTKVKTRTKKVKVVNEDGTITERIVKTRIYKRRRRQKKKNSKPRVLGSTRRGLRVKSIATPKTAKGRLALTLGMVPPKKPGQLLPDVKVKPSSRSHITSMDLNRARAGIPKLHIFGPRNELQYYSSESEPEEYIEGGSGDVATVVPQRTGSSSRLQDRKKAALTFQSAPSASTSRPKLVTEPPTSEYVDILGSIMDSQAVWHSKNTNVKINDDGSIVVIKENKPESSKPIDVREENVEGLTTQAPMQPGASSRPGGFRSNNRSSYGETRQGSQDSSSASRAGQSNSGVNFNRFGAPARNDREGYTNYLNNMPQGPTPFCRGGPPLRFRMPPRPQLRRITIPVRNRVGSQRGEDEEDENDKQIDKPNEEEAKKDGEEESEMKKQEEEEDIDLYSDIESNIEKPDNPGGEDGGPSTSSTEPSSEPPTGMMGLEETENFKEKTQVYDPAEPCDSDEEMVIDENKVQSPSSEKEEREEKKPEETKPNSPIQTLKKNSDEEDDDDDDDDNDCPIFSIYSSTTREFSQKEEEERQREVAEEKKKIEQLKLKDSDNVIDKFKKNDEAEPIESIEEMPKEDDDLEKTLEEKIKEPIEEKKNEEISEKKNEKIDEEMEAKIDENLEEKIHDKIEEKTEENIEEKIEKNVEEKIVEKIEDKTEDKPDDKDEGTPYLKLLEESSQSPFTSATEDKLEEKLRSPSTESESKKSKSLASLRDKSSSPEIKKKRSKRRSKTYESDSDEDDEKDKENEGELVEVKTEVKNDGDSGSETVSKVATGLEGLDVEEVSSENADGGDFPDKRSMSSLSLSDMSNRSKRSKSPVQTKKKKRNKKKKSGKSKEGKNYEEGELDDSEKDNKKDDKSEASKKKTEESGNENQSKTAEKTRTRSRSKGSEKQTGSKDHKKQSRDKSKERDLNWKKPSKKEKNYREGKKRSRDRGRTRSGERRRSRSPSPKKYKKDRKEKDRKKKTERKKELERYDVRKIVKNKDVRKTDAFGRDLHSKSRSITRSRSRSPIRERSRNVLRRESRSFSRSRSRSFRRGRSPFRRRYLRSRSRSRSKSVRSFRRSFSRSRSRSRSRRSRRQFKSNDRFKGRSRSRAWKSRSISRVRRRSPSISRSRSPFQRMRSRRPGRSRRSWSHQLSRTPSFSPRRSRSMSRSPLRVRRSYSRSLSSRSWSRGQTSIPRASSLEKLTVVLTTKDKKKKKKEIKKIRKEEKKKKKAGNSKEVFASGDNVLVSLNFRNTESSGNILSEERTTRLGSLSPTEDTEPRKKKKGSDYEGERVSKKSKKTASISKKVVDVALANASNTKRTKKLTRLNEKDAEVILSRKPVAVIDLELSPYREQTPSPVNVVVVSDSGSGDEGKETTPQRANPPGTEVEVIQENVVSQSANVSEPCSPLENGYSLTSGPKTPPEPQIKFSINKPQQLRPIANPLGDDDDDEEEEDEREPEAQEPRVESLDRRIEKELNQPPGKGPNTPPAPRGPSTPKTPPSPQSSPDAYDPFEPTKSRSTSPSQADKENCPTPKGDGNDDPGQGNPQVESGNSVPPPSVNSDKTETNSENLEEKVENVEKSEVVSQVDSSSQGTNAPASETKTESPEKKITVQITTQQTKPQPTGPKPYTPTLKPLPPVSTSTTLPSISDMFSSSPTKTSRTGTTIATQTQQISGLQRLQHRLGSPVSRTPSSVKTTPEKISTPTQLITTGNYLIRNATKRNGEQQKQPRPLQDATNETIDMTALELDDSPYSPASSEGDDLFDPPVDPPKPSNSSKPTPTTFKTIPKPTHKSPVKQLSKFDLLFGPSGPTLSPLKVGPKKTAAKAPPKPSTGPKVLPTKPGKKPTSSNKKGVIQKMDEDQLRILDDLPSSAVELQVKDKFLKKLNRQERVVDEVKTVLKPHYARKHITKEEYKDILRRSVPKICHSRSGEINPSKIQSLIEAYVRKFRHAKKKGMNVSSKTKQKKTMFS